MELKSKKASSDVPPEQPSAKVGRYNVGAKIGVGAFSDVYVGHDETTGEPRALKRLRNKFDDWSSVVKIRDVQTLARLARHPNIVTLFEVHRTATGDVWLVLEKMQVSLHDVLVNYSGPLPRTAIVDWTRDALVGIQFLHDSMYLHRDIKPENMLLSAEGTLKLSDFSLARGFHEAQHDLTTYVSTRWYRAPEVLLGVAYGHPIDYFAAGCVLAELYARQALFPADSEISLFHQIVTCLGHPPFMDKFLTSHSIDMPPPLVGTPIENLRSKTGMPDDALEVAVGLLDVDPSQRWTSVEALAHPFFHQARVDATAHGADWEPDMGGQGHSSAAVSLSPRPLDVMETPSVTASVRAHAANSLFPTSDDAHRSPAASSGTIRNPYKRAKQQFNSSRRY